MRRSRIKRISEKRIKRMAQVKPFRDALIEQTGACMICGAGPKSPKHRVPEYNMLCCHEILNGPLRDTCLDERSCLIVACWLCNSTELNWKGDWPLQRQLAVIKAKAPERYDLRRVLLLRNPKAPGFITEDQVDYWVDRDWGETT